MCKLTLCSKLINAFDKNFTKGYKVAQGPTTQILVSIQLRIKANVDPDPWILDKIFQEARNYY